MKTYPTLPQPCSDCPFRNANRDRPHPKGIYETGLIVALWQGGRHQGSKRTDVFPGFMALKHGARQMTCHKTDPKDVPGATLHACVGALVCQHREVIRANELGDAYRRAHPHGLELHGVLSVAGTMLGRAVTWTEFKAIPHRTLIDAATRAIADISIGHPKLQSPTYAEYTFNWASKRKQDEL